MSRSSFLIFPKPLRSISLILWKGRTLGIDGNARLELPHPGLAAVWFCQNIVGFALDNVKRPTVPCPTTDVTWCKRFDLARAVAVAEALQGSVVGITGTVGCSAAEKGETDRFLLQFGVAARVDADLRIDCGMQFHPSAHAIIQQIQRSTLAERNLRRHAWHANDTI